MKSVSRRSFIIATGVVTVLSDILARSKPARAWLGQEDGESFEDFSTRCHLAGGNVNRLGDFNYCENTDKDRQCKAAHNNEYVMGEEGKSNEECEDEAECFLTSACVEHASLLDDCFELTALRHFRDQYLSNAMGGMDDINIYYRAAPKILSRINSSAQSSREFPRIYILYILPCAIASRLGLNDFVRRRYTSMMNDLSTRYQVPL